MIISWWSKHIGVILSVLMCDIWINVLLQTSALVGPLHIVNWNARWNSEMRMQCFINVPNLSKSLYSTVHNPIWETAYLWNENEAPHELQHDIVTSFFIIQYNIIFPLTY
jgi:hypothetical protein